MEARLSWTGSGLVFDGGPAGGPQIVVDGDSATGPSPMELVLSAVAACMAIDVRVILGKGRVPLDALDVVARAERRDEPPRHFTALELTFRVAGAPPGSREKIERAIELSRKRYCSVFLSLRSDLELQTAVEGV